MSKERDGLNKAVFLLDLAIDQIYQSSTSYGAHKVCTSLGKEKLELEGLAAEASLSEESEHE